jgi:ribosomal protein S18 acetylase RimI-like enzyme
MLLEAPAMETMVRRAGSLDLDAIVGNNLAMASETEGRSLDPKVARAGVDAVLSDPGKGFYLVVESLGRIVGQCMITYEWSDWRDGVFWWIQSVYVEPEARGRGVFTSLFREVERLAMSDEVVVGLRLYVERNNRLAQGVYSRMGMDGSHYIVFESDFTKRE